VIQDDWWAKHVASEFEAGKERAVMQPGLNSVDWWSDMVEMEWAEQDNNVRSHDGSLAAPVLSLAGPELLDPVLEL